MSEDERRGALGPPKSVLSIYKWQAPQRPCFEFEFATRRNGLIELS